MRGTSVTLCTHPQRNGIDLLGRPQGRETPRWGTLFQAPAPGHRVDQTFTGQLDLERHGGRTPAGVWIRVLQRILALTAALWHNDHANQPVKRALTAYDH